MPTIYLYERVLHIIQVDVYEMDKIVKIKKKILDNYFLLYLIFK